MLEIFPELTSFNFVSLLRLVAAVILGGIIGFERSGNKHEAGLRTHIIVCLGAASVMLLGEMLCIRYSGEVTRLSAQVISGVGFLGAGSIIMDGNRIRGITTAAGIWTTACVGLIVGAGYYIIAFSTVVLMMVAMIGLRSFGKKIAERTVKYSLKIECSKREGVKEVLNLLLSDNAIIRTVKFDKEENEEIFGAIIEFSLPGEVNFDKLIIDIITMDSVILASPNQ